MEFLEKYKRVRKEKNSILCIGLDPVISKLNSLGYDIKTPEEAPEIYLKFCLDVVDKTHQFACAFKPNRQFILPLSLKQVQRLNERIHDYGCISILDHKLSDIGKTNAEGMFWIKQEGFDAFTCSPFAGNIEESIIQAHGFGLGIIFLCLMSNPEAVLFMKGKFKEGDSERFGYKKIAAEVARYGADGVVVGATGHITPEDLVTIRKYIGPDMIELIPGVGTQKGDERKVILYGGENILINVGSALIFEKEIDIEAAKWRQKFNEILAGKK